MQHHTRRGVRTGITFAVTTLAMAFLLPAPWRLQFLAGILFLTAGIYLGFAWVDGRKQWERLEGLVALPFFAAALIGLQVPWVLALGFALHILWDVAHHPRAVQTTVAKWLPPACLLYDGAVAVAILLWWPPIA